MSPWLNPFPVRIRLSSRDHCLERDQDQDEPGAMAELYVRSLSTGCKGESLDCNLQIEASNIATGDPRSFVHHTLNRHLQIDGREADDANWCAT
jgi:hypothetical protein